MIPEQARKLMTFKGYYEFYCDMLKYYDCNSKYTYEAVEREYKHYFGMNKYTTFESFRRTLYRHKRNLLFKVETF